MKFIVKTPSEVFNEVRAGIKFEQGKAEFEDAALVDVFKFEFGYEVSEVKEEQAAPVKKPTKKRGE